MKGEYIIDKSFSVVADDIIFEYGLKSSVLEDINFYKPYVKTGKNFVVVSVIYC